MYALKEWIEFTGRKCEDECETGEKGSLRQQNHYSTPAETSVSVQTKSKNNA